jgi:hypothetical protein
MDNLTELDSDEAVGRACGDLLAAAAKKRAQGRTVGGLHWLAGAVHTDSVEEQSVQL